MQFWDEERQVGRKTTSLLIVIALYGCTRCEEKIGVEGDSCRTTSDCAKDHKCIVDECLHDLTMFCRKLNDCNEMGACTWNQQLKSCAPTSNADCKMSIDCVNKGLCYFKQGSPYCVDRNGSNLFTQSGRDRRLPTETKRKLNNMLGNQPLKR